MVMSLRSKWAVGCDATLDPFRAPLEELFSEFPNPPHDNTDVLRGAPSPLTGLPEPDAA